MKSFVVVLIVMGGTSIMLTACDWRPRAGPPWMQKLLFEGPEGPPKFQMGWRHGCETGIATTSNLMQKYYYRFTQDYRYAQDPVYYAGWKNGWSYCQRYIFQYNKRLFL